MSPITTASTYKESKYNVSFFKSDQCVLYNTLSGCLSILEKEEVESLKCILEKDKDDISRVEENFLDRLIINNFVVPGDVDETILLEEKYNNTRNNNNNVSITILPTLDCNFSCRYCYQGNAKIGRAHV